MIRKGLKQKLLLGISTMVMSFVIVAPCSMVTYASEGMIVESESVDSGDYGIMPFSDIIEYRYKVVGTKMYRRLYNYTEQCWIGEWEYIGEGYIEPGVH